MLELVRSKLLWSFMIGGISSLFLLPIANANEVRITQETLQEEFSIGRKTIVIKREQDKDNVLTGSYAKTSRSCPPFCIHPMKAAEGVETFGELEVIEFLKTEVNKGNGLLVDARIPSWYKKGTIPGALNIPFTIFSDKNPYLEDLLPVLGAKRAGEDKWDFSKSKSLVMFCNGPWCDQSPRAISGLLSVGYPAEKLFYYRGGMQNWLMLGLSVETPEELATPDKTVKNNN